MEKRTLNVGKPKLWTRDFIFSCLANLAIYLVFFGFAPTLPIYIEKFGGSSTIAGLAMASLTLAAVFSRPVAGWALDRYGRKLIFLGGLLLLLIPTVLYAFMVPVLFLIALRFVQGLGWGVANNSSWTVSSDIIPLERLGEGTGFFSATLSIAMAVAPAIALWLIAQHSFEVLFWVCSILTIVPIILALMIKYPYTREQAAGAQAVFVEKTSLPPATAALFIGIAYSAQLSFISLYTIQQGMVSAGLYFSAFAISTLLFRPFSGIIIDRQGEKGYDLVVLIGCVALAAAILVLFALSTPLHLIIAGTLYGLGFGFIQPTLLAQCIKRVPPGRRGAANATYWTAFDIGVAAGSAGWGFVVSTLGYSNMFLLTLIPALIALIVYFASSRGSTPVSLDA
ncbi:MAG TPA: MFS transporter [Firmicutes bacterium]|jgi:MFS family permease|nr:MFS transporter [Bacillota bacterium]